MPKLKNFKLLFKNRAKLRGSIDQILYTEKIADIKNTFGVSGFPVVDISLLFSAYPGADLFSPVKIRTDFTSGSSPLNDYFFLCKILNAINARNYFEIGTWVGLSAMNLAINSPAETNIYTLDLDYNHPDLETYSIPKEVFGRHSKNIPNVTHLKGDSKSFDFSPYQKKMDMVFVDGSHSLDYVTNDTRKAFGLLRNSDSVIVWHDYLIGGEVNPEVLCGILSGLPQSEHRFVYHLDQSNTAIYSRTFSFDPAPMEKWGKHDTMFDLRICAENSGNSGEGK